MNKRETSASIYALCAVLLWSTVATAFKLGLAQLTPAQLLLGACAVSTIFFALVEICIGRGRHRTNAGDNSGPAQTQPKDSRAWWQAACLGLVNPLLYYLVLFEAYARLPAQLAQPLNYTWAITLALMAIPILGQPLTARGLAGILLSYVGVLVLLVGASSATNLEWNAFGVGLALASTLLWASYWLASTRSTMAGPKLLLVNFAIATACLALYCWVDDSLPPLNQHTIAYSLWVGLVEMGLAYLLWQQALRQTRHAARLSQLIFLSPFISLVLIAQVLGETIAASSVIGLAIIVAGIGLARQPAT